MPREIKFRAWDGEKIIWPTGINLDHENGNKSQNADFILMQFTGLKDKNGKEIYEGDIVEFESEYGKAISEIKFPDDYQFFVNDNSKKAIGNIYENPELLK